MFLYDRQAVQYYVAVVCGCITCKSLAKLRCLLRVENVFKSDRFQFEEWRQLTLACKASDVPYGATHKALQFMINVIGANMLQVFTL